MAPGIVVRTPARTSLHVEIRIDPPSGPAKEPEEPSDPRPPFLAPDSDQKISPSPKSHEPPRLGQRAVRSTAQESATPSRTSELLQTIPQEARCSLLRSFQIEPRAAQPGGPRGFPLQESAPGSKEQ